MGPCRYRVNKKESLGFRKMLLILLCNLEANFEVGNRKKIDFQFPKNDPQNREGKPSVATTFWELRFGVPFGAPSPPMGGEPPANLSVPKRRRDKELKRLRKKN